MQEKLEKTVLNIRNVVQQTITQQYKLFLKSQIWSRSTCRATRVHAMRNSSYFSNQLLYSLFQLRITNFDPAASYDQSNLEM